jgi:hypothetical protein
MPTSISPADYVRRALKQRQRGFGAPDFSGWFATLLLVGAVVGFAVAIGVPALWVLVKPLLHSLTAQ